MHPTLEVVIDTTCVCGETTGPLIAAPPHLMHMLNHIAHTLEVLVSDQSRLDADVTNLQATLQDLTVAISSVETEVQALKAAAAASQPLDFTRLDEVTGGIRAAVTALQGAALPTAPTASTPSAGDTTPADNPPVAADTGASGGDVAGTTPVEDTPPAPPA